MAMNFRHLIFALAALQATPASSNDDQNMVSKYGRLAIWDPGNNSCALSLKGTEIGKKSLFLHDACNFKSDDALKRETQIGGLKFPAYDECGNEILVFSQPDKIGDEGRSRYWVSFVTPSAISTYSIRDIPTAIDAKLGQGCSVVFEVKPEPSRRVTPIAHRYVVSATGEIQEQIDIGDFPVYESETSRTVYGKFYRKGLPGSKGYPAMLTPDGVFAFNEPSPCEIHDIPDEKNVYMRYEREKYSNGYIHEVCRQLQLTPLPGH